LRHDLDIGRHANGGILRDRRAHETSRKHHHAEKKNKGRFRSALPGED
jgi:hypothetical protein